MATVPCGGLHRASIGTLLPVGQRAHALLGDVPEHLLPVEHVVGAVGTSVRALQARLLRVLGCAHGYRISGEGWCVLRVRGVLHMRRGHVSTMHSIVVSLTVHACSAS